MILDIGFVKFVKDMEHGLKVMIFTFQIVC